VVLERVVWGDIESWWCLFLFLCGFQYPAIALTLLLCYVLVSISNLIKKLSANPH
jgi:hypothetical protein